jgi:hypothetical protein
MPVDKARLLAVVIFLQPAIALSLADCRDVVLCSSSSQSYAPTNLMMQ